MAIDLNAIRDRLRESQPVSVGQNGQLETSESTESSREGTRLKPQRFAA